MATHRRLTLPVSSTASSRGARNPIDERLVLGLAVVVAALVRRAIGGSAPAASPPAAVAFSLILIAAVVWARPRFTRVRWRDVGIGAMGAAALVALSIHGLPAAQVGPRAATPTLLWWVALTTLVATSEELVLRGVLFNAVRMRFGDAAAVAITAVLFALIHVPLYGVPALGIDLCVGVFLGCLRVASGGVAAPVIAHVFADLATGWLG